jgi:hypothetical protein
VAAIAMSWTGACTTRVVDFAGHDAGTKMEAALAPIADAPPEVAPVVDAPPEVAPVVDAAPDAPADEAPPDSTPVSPRDLTPPLDDQFSTQPKIDGPSLYVLYKCCDDAGSICSVWSQGDGVTCRDIATWTIAAMRDCGSRGFNATGIGLYGSCE